jgi:hypothetical protein
MGIWSFIYFAFERFAVYASSNVKNNNRQGTLLIDDRISTQKYEMLMRLVKILAFFNALITIQQELTPSATIL